MRAGRRAAPNARPAAVKQRHNGESAAARCHAAHVHVARKTCTLRWQRRRQLAGGVTGGASLVARRKRHKVAVGIVERKAQLFDGAHNGLWPTGARSVGRKAAARPHLSGSKDRARSKAVLEQIVAVGADAPPTQIDAGRTNVFDLCARAGSGDARRQPRRTNKAVGHAGAQRAQHHLRLLWRRIVAARRAVAIAGRTPQTAERCVSARGATPPATYGACSHEKAWFFKLSIGTML